MGTVTCGKGFDADEHQELVQRARDEGFHPSVDVFLPVCHESFEVLENTWKHVAAVRHPGLKVYVLDDGAKEEIRTMAKIYGFECESTRRRSRPAVVERLVPSTKDSGLVAFPA